MGACKWLEDNETNYELMFDSNHPQIDQTKANKQSSLLPNWVNSISSKKDNYKKKMTSLNQNKLELLKTKANYQKFAGTVQHKPTTSLLENENDPEKFL